ncbi:phytanoyl-CoA dioxygenase family protein [Paraburkholderia aspalathi]|uniref:phytanoyl-CoA dioxygenase family protein n=1 Tax=Paraburkholderia aspalathi TaxID=1324617 RepID=UPI0038B89F76
MLGPTDKAAFERNGYAVLPGFYGPKQIDEILAQIQNRKLQRPLKVTVDLLDTGERTTLGLLSPDDIAGRRMKINDLYLDMPAVRELALSERITPILNSLLGADAALCNSLYFEHGSTQPPHVDALFMTPTTPGHLIAIWVALEDTHRDAGPLVYFPGSHLIRQHIFSTGTQHFVQEEMPAWDSYIMSEVARLGLKKQSFAARKGDVFIWHAHLLHGGGPIHDASRTRRSLVFHYYSKEDSRGHNYELACHGDGLWIDRAPQEVPPAVAERVLSESRYRERYPDVAEAIKSGHFESGRHHFDLFGNVEGRIYGS